LFLGPGASSSVLRQWWSAARPVEGGFQPGRQNNQPSTFASAGPGKAPSGGDPEGGVCLLAGRASQPDAGLASTSGRFSAALARLLCTVVLVGFDAVHFPGGQESSAGGVTCFGCFALERAASRSGSSLLGRAGPCGCNPGQGSVRRRPRPPAG